MWHCIVDVNSKLSIKIIVSGGFTIVDFTVPTRDSPVVHPCAEAPICEECRAADLCFFDPTCSSCQDVLSNPKTTISQLFAIMRQWIPQTQGHLTLLTREVLRRGAHVNDKDGLTDLSLLHFASKAGAVGIGNGTTAANLVNTLLNKGASTDLKCHWTDMNALHYAVFFDCAEVVELLCEHNPVLLTTISSQFDGGNSLHIAAASLSLASAKTLLKYKADAGFADATGLLPHEVIPQVSSNSDKLIAKELRDCLHEASLSRPPIKTVRRSESPSAHSLSSTGTRGSRGSPASNKPTLSVTPTSNLKGVNDSKSSTINRFFCFHYMNG
ncbi:PREDICTED: CAP-Gly domain-containing linker protein 3-like [Amphimedon queenslandica]|uniref:SOCS box domain-containing protein n=3 Tax=Amphimedon queenslandica TaxID=400682 RepID=A0AAN0JKR7_AMPQE|nr:PREDICTED: CAP-Gly domain-containing linker protein 3-like [Amphimedon queenslandica]|eukprot:XP_019857361.1 PREDICTED: CAP-Gly domain-containing linker protein 3-like [Amphimedon queenslandica]